MTDFLLELLSQEIPARMQDKACADLARLFEAEIAKAGLRAAAIETYATPRRLALIARDLPAATEPVREETKGPRASAPPQALEGFLRKTGLAREQLTERDGILFAIAERPGRPAADVLARAIPAIVRAFPWPRSMRWGEASASTASLRWVRPLQGIVALLGEEVVPCEIDGIASGAATVGHRFHHPGPITIGSAEDYAFKLRAAHVILDPAERRAIIEEGARAAAEARGLTLVPDESLVAENAGLTEWPVPLLGDFDPAFLEVPREVIQLTMRANQKYFACVDADGRLAPVFICTANIAATDGGAGVIAGNRKVLAARLADARFFWEQDLKVRLEDQAKKLDRIVFHEKLGTVADKAERVAKLARWLVEEGIVGGRISVSASPTVHLRHPRESGDPASFAVQNGPWVPASAGMTKDLAALAEQAARLCKADLVTGMVGEFPELQGVMGGYYARAEGLPDEVADAIRDHYKPVGQSDEVPTAPVTVAVSLADKLDTLAAFFGVEEKPSGSKDPFALRRAALSVVATLMSLQLRLPLRKAGTVAIFQWPIAKVRKPVAAALETFSLFNRTFHPDPRAAANFLAADLETADERIDREEAKVILKLNKAVDNLLFFFADRLKIQQREAGVRHDLIDAVFALGGEDDLVRLLARVHALQAFVGTEDGANLLAGYKRAANILKKEGWAETPSLLVGEEQGGRSASQADLRHAGGMPHRLAGEGIGSAGSMPAEPNMLAAQPLSLPLASGERAPPSPTRAEGEDSQSKIFSDTQDQTPAPEEAALIAALDHAEPEAARAVAAEDFAGAMAALARLRAPIDAFFDKVTVNDPDPAKRALRLALLARVRAAVHQVADFSRIEG